MKKLIAMILTLAMVLSLAACGEKKSDEKKETEPAAPDGETLELELCSLVYDPAAWTYSEDSVYKNKEYAEVNMQIPDGEDGYIVNLQLQVSLTDAGGFRDNLSSNGFDAYKYAVDNAYPLTDVGGVACLSVEGEFWGEGYIRYIGRDEARSVSVWVEVCGAYDDPRVEQLLKGLTIHAEDIGNQDGPWPWEGEAFTSDGGAAGVGAYSVSSQWIPISKCITTIETFDHGVTVAGDKVYLLVNGVLQQYAFDGASLTYEKDLLEKGDFRQLQATDDGTVWASGFAEALVGLQSGTETFRTEDYDYVTMAPSGQWGISWFSGSDCQKIILSGDSFTTVNVAFPQVSSISTLIIDEEYIYIAGQAADESGHKVFVYDPDGVLKLVLEGEGGEALGCITYIAKTANGFIGLDGNLRNVVLWEPDGTFIGALPDGDLFDTAYPWFCGGAKLHDGSILVIMTEDRADESAMELVAFKLTGF